MPKAWRKPDKQASFVREILLHETFEFALKIFASLQFTPKSHVHLSKMFEIETPKLATLLHCTNISF